MKICPRLIIFELSDCTLRIFRGYDFRIFKMLLFLDRYFGVSNIGVGGTRPFSNMWYFRGKFSWYFCEVNFCVTRLWYFCEVLLVVGDLIWFPLHMTNGMVHSIGTGIPAPSDAIDVCFSKHQSALIGGDGDSSSTAGLQARGYRPPRR